MANYDLIVVRRDQATADTQRDLIAETGYWMLAGLKLKDYFKSITSGIHPAAVQTKANLAYATGTITFSSVADADTVTVAGSIYTAKTSGATGTFQFNIGSTDTDAAVNLVAAIAADPITGLQVTATSVGAVTTIKAYVPGKLGHLVALAISAHGTASASFLASGTNGDQERTHYYGSAGSTF